MKRQKIKGFKRMTEATPEAQQTTTSSLPSLLSARSDVCKSSTNIAKSRISSNPIPKPSTCDAAAVVDWLRGNTSRNSFESLGRSPAMLASISETFLLKRLLDEADLIRERARAEQEAAVIAAVHFLSSGDQRVDQSIASTIILQLMETRHRHPLSR